MEVHLGLAPGVIWQAVRLQSHRPGATVFCPHCNSYFIFGPCALSDEAAKASDAQSNAVRSEQEPENNEHGC